MIISFDNRLDIGYILYTLAAQAGHDLEDINPKHPQKLTALKHQQSRISTTQYTDKHITQRRKSYGQFFIITRQFTQGTLTPFFYSQ